MLSHWKIKLLALVPSVVGPFSFVGSLIIIYRILRFDRHDPNCANRRVYHRLLVCLSIYNALECTSLPLGTLPLPKDSGLYGAHGNTATCTAQGFSIQVCTASVLFYNVGLMIYFVLTIRYGWSDAYFAKWLEKIIHALAIIVPLVIGVTGLVNDFFNPSSFGTFCYLSPYPPLCDSVKIPCTRGRMAHAFFRAFILYPWMALVSILFFSVVLIFWTVRQQGRRALHIAANRESIQSQTRAVAMQSAWLGVVFFNTYVYFLVIGSMSRFVKFRPELLNVYYALSVLWVFFFPMQGFLNCVLYLRPRFTRLKREQNLSIWKAMRLAAFGGRETFRAVSTQRRKWLRQTTAGASATQRIGSIAQQSSLNVRQMFDQTRNTPHSDENVRDEKDTDDSTKATDIKVEKPSLENDFSGESSNNETENSIRESICVSPTLESSLLGGTASTAPENT